MNILLELVRGNVTAAEFLSSKLLTQAAYTASDRGASSVRRLGKKRKRNHICVHCKQEFNVEEVDVCRWHIGIMIPMLVNVNQQG